MQGLTEPFFFNIVGCCNFTEAKSCEVYAILLDKGLFLTNRTMFATKCSIWPSNTLKTVNLEYRLLLSLLGWSDFGSKFTKFGHMCIITHTR